MIEININLLETLAGAPVGGMDFDTFYQFV